MQNTALVPFICNPLTFSWGFTLIKIILQFDFVTYITLASFAPAVGHPQHNWFHCTEDFISPDTMSFNTPKAFLFFNLQSQAAAEPWQCYFLRLWVSLLCTLTGMASLQGPPLSSGPQLPPPFPSSSSCPFQFILHTADRGIWHKHKQKPSPQTTEECSQITIIMSNFFR